MDILALPGTTIELFVNGAPEGAVHIMLAGTFLGVIWVGELAGVGTTFELHRIDFLPERAIGSVIAFDFLDFLGFGGHGFCLLGGTLFAWTLFASSLQ